MSQPFYTGGYTMEDLQPQQRGWFSEFTTALGNGIADGPGYVIDMFGDTWNEGTRYVQDPGYAAQSWDQFSTGFERGVRTGPGYAGEALQDIAVESGRLAVEGVQVVGGAVLNPMGEFLSGLFSGPVGIAIGCGVIAATLLKK